MANRSSFVMSSLATMAFFEKRASIADQLFERLRERIVSLQWKPRMVISRQEIAEEFGVSQTPVREALLRLQAQGLVIVYPQSRTEVAPINAKQAREVQFLRRGLETEVAIALSECIDDQGLADLRHIIDAKRAIIENDDMLLNFMRLDRKFHQTMFVMVGQSNLYDLVIEKSVHLDRMRHLQLPQMEKRQRITAEHEAILDAIASRDPRQMNDAIRRHLGSTSNSLGPVEEKFPEYF